MHDAAVKARALRVLGHLDHLQLAMGMGARQIEAGNFCRRLDRPVAASGQRTGIDADIVGDAGGEERALTKIVQGARGDERRGDEAAVLFDQPERRDMRAVVDVGGDDDGTRGSSAWVSSRCLRLVACRRCAWHGRGWCRPLQPAQIFLGRIGRHAPAQAAVLGVALAELPGDLRARQLGPEIEGVAAIARDVQMREQGEGLALDQMAVALKMWMPSSATSMR